MELKTRTEQVYENHMPKLSHFQMLTISESLSSCLRVCSVKCFLSFRGNVGDDQPSPPAEAPSAPAATVIPGVDSLIGDLLDMDLGGPSMQQQQMYPPQPTSQTPVQGGGSMDLLGEGLDSLVSIYMYVHHPRNCKIQ